LPLAFDNQSTFKERIYRDKADPNILHDEITVFDHALTRPWIVDKKYVRNTSPRPEWPEAYCTENPSMIAIGTESYYLSGDGLLMPIRKNQPPPDLRYFKQSRKYRRAGHSLRRGRPRPAMLPRTGLAPQFHQLRF